MPGVQNPNSLLTKYGHIATFFNLHRNTVRNWHQDGILCTRIARHVVNLEFDAMENRERDSNKKSYPLYGKKQ